MRKRQTILNFKSRMELINNIDSKKLIDIIFSELYRCSEEMEMNNFISKESHGRQMLIYTILREQFNMSWDEVDELFLAYEI